ncbi:MAG: metallophosphoesterase [Clostridia bacterium]|nr:metallophosphoesterase [Clostridia bacterium]
MKIPDFIIEVESGRDPVILQLTDPQILDAAQQRVPNRISGAQANYYATNRMETNCFQYMRETIEATKPDLILLTGDLVYGEFDDNGTSFLALVDFMESFNIPWAPVFGNHDNESKKGADWQSKQLEDAKNCLFKQRTLTGNGNYTVGIKQDGELKRVFFMLDSNGCYTISEESRANGHTISDVGFGEDQIDWYTKTAQSITALSPATKLSFAFHIQLGIFEEIGKRYPSSESVDIDTAKGKTEGDFGYLGANLKSAWDHDRSVWNGLKALGVDSIFVGHEHCNSASIVYEGVRLQYGQKSSTYDRVNYLKKDGSIVGSYPPASGTPLVGGTIIPLSQEDGSICDPYIYLCKIEK